MCYQDTEVSFHLKHVRLKPAAASSLLVLPTELNETGHSYAYFVCLAKREFGAELESRGNFQPNSLLKYRAHLTYINIELKIAQCKKKKNLDRSY